MSKYVFAFFTLTNSNYGLTETHILLIMVSKLGEIAVKSTSCSGIFPANRSELAVTPVCTSSGEDASADMLYGDINLASHRANGESS